MKNSAGLRVILVLLLLVSPAAPAAAQNSSTDCDQLRTSITQLEAMDINAMPSSLRQLYKESLLKLYTQFDQCVQREISVAAQMRKAVGDSAAAPGIEARLRALTKEKSDNDGKLSILRTALNHAPGGPPPGTADEAAAGPSAEDGATAAAPPRRDAPAPTPATPAPTPAAAQPAAASCAAPAAYDDAPGILKDIVAKAAADTVRTNDPDRSIFPGVQMVLYAVFDAASPTSSKLVRGLEAYQYLGETARTDKQLGASAKSEGAVSAIEKPGFARLLGFAIEHGGITKKNDGTNLTLSTSLYSLYAMNGGDTAETYDRAGVLNRIGVSAAFAVSDQDNELANARRNNLSEWSVKARLFGDRSTRSPAFQKFWDEQIRPRISDRLQSLGKASEELATKSLAYGGLQDDTLDDLPDLVKARMECPDYKAAATADAKKKIISDLILGRLKTQAFDPVRSGRVALGADEIARIETQFLPDLKRSLDNLVLADAELRKRIDDLKKGPMGTFAYTNHRTPAGSDYSETKFLWEQDKSFLRPLKLTGNFGLTFYHRPDAALRQEKLRDVTAALSFDGSTRSPFTEAENQSKITYSFVGRYERLFENRRRPDRKPDLATAQFVVEIPFIKGLSLPLSLTYANATEEERKKNVRFNFGFRLDTDKLIELLTTTPR